MGRSRFVFLAVALALIVASCGWTQYAGNASRTGYAPFESGLTTANAGQAVVKWRGNQFSGQPVIANGMIYGAGSGELKAWSALTNPSCTGAPLTCPPMWSAHTSDFAASSPAVAGNTVFIATASTTAWHLYAFDALGHADCTTYPVSGCLPIWIGTWGSRSGAAVEPLVAVSDGRVFVQTRDLDTQFSDVTTFDATGTTNCAGSPLTCSPLFRTTAFASSGWRSPTVDGGRLYIPTVTSIGVFDATGATNCVSGTCAALFILSVSPSGEVAVANGVAFTTSADRLLAFDATGHTGCSGGPPQTCQPLWGGDLVAPTNGDAPIVAGNRVYANSRSGTNSGAIEAFDRLPGPSCAGSPLSCPRLFLTRTNATFDDAHASASANLLVVASRTLPNPPLQQTLNFELSFFDLNGNIGCAGVPKTCAAIGTVPLGSDPNGTERPGRPALGSGLVVVGYLFAPPLVVGLP